MLPDQTKVVRIECQAAALVNLDDILPFQGELKTLDEEDYQKLKKEIVEDGFSAPFFLWRCVDVGPDSRLVRLYTLDGHQRLKSLKRMRDQEGFTIPELPAVWVEAPDVSAAKRKLLAFTSQYGKMTARSLATYLQETKLEFQDTAMRFRFPEVKFDAVNDILNPKKEEEPPPGDGANDGTEPRVKLGQLWQLGDHRLLCGDSLDPQSFVKLLEHEQVDCVWTDPPYNVALGMDETPEQAAARNRRTDGKVVQNDKMSDADFLAFLTKAFEHMVMRSKFGAAFYIAHADSEGLNFRAAAKSAGWDLKQCLIWAKSSLVMGRQDYQWQHEPILYGWRPGAAHSWYGDRDKSTVLKFDKPSRSEIHPTMKPVELVEHCLQNSTVVGDLVLDAFGGSGTTLIAADRLRRRARLIELDPRYAEAILTRWETHSQQKATLIS